MATILVREARSIRPATIGRGTSIREVCLVGAASRSDWAPGTRVDWSGRSYRVAAVQDGPRYVHLEPADAPGR